jgi:hypothetical protein
MAAIYHFAPQLILLAVKSYINKSVKTIQTYPAFPPSPWPATLVLFASLTTTVTLPATIVEPSISPSRAIPRLLSLTHLRRRIQVPRLALHDGVPITSPPPFSSRSGDRGLPFNPYHYYD